MRFFAQAHPSICKQHSFTLQQNSIHFSLHAAPGSRESKLMRWSCPHPPCGDAVLTLAHLLECDWAPIHRFRGDLRRRIISTFSNEPCTAAWLVSNDALQLLPLLRRLFPISASATPAENIRHLTRALCGAFSRGQENAAAKALGFPSAASGRATLLRMRLLCLERLQRFYHRLE